MNYFIPADRELEELCALAVDVPKLWTHPLVTYQDRKDIIRVLIERIDVIATNEKIKGVVHWKSGQTMPVNVWLQAGRHNLIRELHAEGLSVPEIQERMAAGENSTGQRRSYNVLSIYLILKKLGLKPHRRPKWISALPGRSGEALQRGPDNAANRRSIQPATAQIGIGKIMDEKVGILFTALDRIHFEAISDARKRRLKASEIAAEFNNKDVPRRDNRPWTSRAVSERWCDLSKRFKGE